MKYTPIIAIVAIFILEVIALCNHIDGIALGTGLAAIGGIGGYNIKGQIERWRRGRG